MSDLLSTLAEISLTMSAVILLLLVLGPLLAQRYAPQWRYWAWLAVAVRLLIPVNLSLPQAPVTLEAPPDRVVYAAPSAPEPSPAPAAPSPAPGGQEVAGNPAPSGPPDGAAPARSLTLSQALFWLWLSGMAVTVLWHLVGWLRFQSYLRRWAVPAEAPAFLPALLEELELPVSVRLLSCPGLEGPMMTGLLRPTVLLPQGDTDRDALWFILRHELTHFKRRDIPYKALLLCAGVVHWFNPLVWLMLRAAEGDLERACDADVVRGLPQADRARYGQVILDAVRGRG